MVARKIEGMFGGSFSPQDLPAIPDEPLPESQDARYPQISAEEWEARERPRQLLENILNRQVESCAALRKATRQEIRKGPSGFERAAEIAPTHPDSRLMRRMQDSNFREVRRLTNLLLKLKRSERRTEDSQKAEDEKTIPTDGVEPAKNIEGAS
jgi:hypothetical protein